MNNVNCMSTQTVETNDLAHYQLDEQSCMIAPASLINYKSTSDFNGVPYPLLKISTDTPIIFQWFNCGGASQFADDEIPILNTRSHPYLNNIIIAATIESNRIIGVFIGGDISHGQIRALAALEEKYKNIKVLYKESLDFSQYDKKIEDIVDLHARTAVNESESRDLNLFLDEFKGETLLSMYDKRKGHTWFDLYRNLIVMKGGSAFIEANKSGCENIDKEGGCIYLDMDMVLTGKLSDIYLPDGIGLHIKRSANSDEISMENSIIAVNRCEHPALQEGLNIMHKNAFAHPYYDGMCKGVRNHFKFSVESNYKDLCSFIEFKCSNIDMDTSRRSASSWC